MLETLRIQNYALIDAIEVEFAPGFNVLTGETGAGKSILVGALNLVLGARASNEAVRQGAEYARVEAAFRLERVPPRLQSLFEEHDIEIEDDTLLLARTISAEGRGRAYAGGRMTPVAVLAAIGDELVDLHGQHEHQSLLKADRQLDLLDAYARANDAAAAVAAAVAKVRAIEAEKRALTDVDRDRLRRLDFLRHELQEIDDANLTPGEDATIESRLKRITNAEALFALAGKLHGLLYANDDGAAIDALNVAARDMDELIALDAEFAPLGEQLNTARDAVEAVAEELRGVSEGLDFDPVELDELNARKMLIASLKRKYGASIEEILGYREQAAEEIARHDERDERLEQLEAALSAARTEADRAAAALSAKRRKAAGKLDKQVAEALQGLGMKGARFETRLSPTPLGTRGAESAAFQLAANAGEALKPLRQVASGGEVSRIMLALKSVFADADAIPTLIFDEIDAGVGGVVARRVAERMRRLAASHQVICITHIPQIAAVAHAHFNVSKSTRKKRTTTSVAPVTDTARVAEVARLLDGSVSDLSLEHARALLAETAS